MKKSNNNKGVALQAYIIDKRIKELNDLPSPESERLVAHPKDIEVSSAIILEVIHCAQQGGRLKKWEGKFVERKSFF